MPRTRLRREPCDCMDCREPEGRRAPPHGSAAIARQDPAPKSLVVCLVGALDSADSAREADVPHLDAVVADGWAGLLACRAGGPPLPHQLLGIVREGAAPPQSLPDRFKQLRAVLLTDDAAVAEAGGMAGCYQVPAPYGAGWQAAGDIAAHICRLLQVQPLHAPGAADAAPALAAVLAAAGAATGGSGEGEEESDDVVDMVLLVLHAPNAPGSSGGDDGGGSAGDGVAALEWADSLVRALNQAPGFRDTVLLSFVLGPGQQPLSAAPLLRQEQALLQPGAPAGAGPAAADCPAVRRPLQSFQCAGQERVAVDPHRPALVVQRLRAVIRRVVDRARHLGLPHIVQHGGAGGILAERLLPEVACKLGRAPKYGA